MSKIQKQPEVKRLPLSDWDIFPWSKEMWQKHEVDFQNILKEYRELKTLNGNDAILARKVWMERKGGIIMVAGSKDVDETFKREAYQQFSSMFDRFSEWLSQKEKSEMTEEQMKIKRDCLKEGIKPINFSIPKEIMDGMERDISNDEMAQDALDKF